MRHRGEDLCGDLIERVEQKSIARYAASSENPAQSAIATWGEEVHSSWTRVVVYSCGPSSPMPRSVRGNADDVEEPSPRNVRRAVPRPRPGGHLWHV